jgi:hypothetical protein
MYKVMPAVMLVIMRFWYFSRAKSLANDSLQKTESFRSDGIHALLVHRMDLPSTGVALPSSPFIFRVTRPGLDHLVSASSLLCITYIVLHDQPHSAVHVMH